MNPRPNTPPVPFGVNPLREFRAVYALLEWRRLPWWERLWYWLEGVV